MKNTAPLQCSCRLGSYDEAVFEVKKGSVEACGNTEFDAKSDTSTFTGRNYVGADVVGAGAGGPNCKSWDITQTDLSN